LQALKESRQNVKKKYEAKTRFNQQYPREGDAGKPPAEAKELRKGVAVVITKSLLYSPYAVPKAPSFLCLSMQHDAEPHR
jgi:hypothetical protein